MTLFYIARLISIA